MESHTSQHKTQSMFCCSPNMGWHSKWQSGQHFWQQKLVMQKLYFRFHGGYEFAKRQRNLNTYKQQRSWGNSCAGNIARHLLGPPQPFSSSSWIGKWPLPSSVCSGHHSHLDKLSRDLSLSPKILITLKNCGLVRFQNWRKKERKKNR